MKKEDFQDGIELLKQPVLPLVSMVQFMYHLSDSKTTIEDIIAEMTQPIETVYTVYPDPAPLLRGYIDQLHLVETPEKVDIEVVNEAGQPVDAVTACVALMKQRILEAELEEINSLLCVPCHCQLCCVGPEKDMAQEFFEIPLQDAEINLFTLSRHDTPASRSSKALDAAENDVFQVNGRPFYQGTAQGSTPELFHWQNGWSMILPKEASCPALEQNGRCTVYSQRPQVCRRPQIFSYILEPLPSMEAMESMESMGQRRKYRIRNSLLAVTDCPYVQLLQDEIAAYAAASELQCILKANKG
ncbi:MAG: hypothetical protein D3911_12415 [Candidatus Electrothrix sp. AW3_4]|nr:hypothetical protein [Candidatus Electrothrix gigas]